MKISIKRNILLNSLSKTQSIAEKRNTMPILSNILLETEKDNLIIKAINLEVGIKLIIEAKIEEQGKVLICAKSIFDIVKEMPEGEINISLKDNNMVEISSGKAIFNLVSSDYLDYPKMIDISNAKFAIMPILTLKKMIEKTIFSISTDETRPFLNGAFLEFIKNNNSIRMVTTDGRRLSLTENNIGKSNFILDKGIIIPKKGLSEILKNFEAGDESSFITVENNYLIIKNHDTVLYMRLIMGEYPDYNRPIPKEMPLKIYINKESFLSSLKRVSLVSDEKTRPIKLNIDKNTMKLYSVTSEMGDGKEDITIETEGSDQNLEISFNSRFLIEILSVIEENQILFELKDPYCAGIIRPFERKDLFYVVMPLRA